LRIEEYSLRRGSGGSGRHAGGEGVVRRYRALVPCTVTLLTERRRNAPRGAASGGPGRPGRNLLNGRELLAKCQVDLKPDDVLTIETPGGGGWGAPL
jgi:N-methylhydantoinase B